MDSQDLVRRTQAQKAAADKVAQGLTEQLAKTEEQLVFMRAEMADKMHELSCKHSEQEHELSHKLAESRRECERQQLQRSQHESKAKEAARQIDTLQKQLEQAARDKDDAVSAARQADTCARQAQDLAARENERLQHSLGNASAQLTVLMDTIETLQGATSAEQRVAKLSTKLSSAQAVELQLELSNSQVRREKLLCLALQVGL